ncbi:hypothetical protein SDC9_169523 [bioreactor metagenome]|uniref:Uncharacterized protein n=1 Tax=bioreactor metagenome TaxID=1076179 RepID=A0A645G823_9ZZZZ
MVERSVDGYVRSALSENLNKYVIEALERKLRDYHFERTFEQANKDAVYAGLAGKIKVSLKENEL